MHVYYFLVSLFYIFFDVFSSLLLPSSIRPFDYELLHSATRCFGSEHVLNRPDRIDMKEKREDCGYYLVLVLESSLFSIFYLTFFLHFSESSFLSLIFLLFLCWLMSRHLRCHLPENELADDNRNFNGSDESL